MRCLACEQLRLHARPRGRANPWTRPAIGTSRPDAALCCAIEHAGSQRTTARSSSACAAPLVNAVFRMPRRDLHSGQWARGQPLPPSTSLPSCAASRQQIVCRRRNGTGQRAHTREAASAHCGRVLEWKKCQANAELKISRGIGVEVRGKRGRRGVAELEPRRGGRRGPRPMPCRRRHRQRRAQSSPVSTAGAHPGAPVHMHVCACARAYACVRACASAKVRLRLCAPKCTCAFARQRQVEPGSISLREGRAVKGNARRLLDLREGAVRAHFFGPRFASYVRT